MVCHWYCGRSKYVVTNSNKHLRAPFQASHLGALVAMYHVDIQHQVMNATMICLWWIACKKGPCTLNNCKMSNPYQVYELGQPSIRFGLQICMQCCESICPSVCLIACIYLCEIFDATCRHTLRQSDCARCLSFLHKEDRVLRPEAAAFLNAFIKWFLDWDINP